MTPVVSARGQDLRRLSRGYSREPAVERELQALVSSGAVDKWRRLSIQEHADADRPHVESMVYLTRQFAANGDMESSWRVIGLLIKRIHWNMHRLLCAICRPCSRHRTDRGEDLAG